MLRPGRICRSQSVCRLATTESPEPMKGVRFHDLDKVVNRAAFLRSTEKRWRQPRTTLVATSLTLVVAIEAVESARGATDQACLLSDNQNDISLSSNAY